MPGPLVIPLIAAGASIASQAANARATGRMNKKQRKFIEERYNIERQDALSDWNMQNEYNSPAAQMERFRAAGLNPNLIYGQQNEGATVRSSNSASWSPKTPEFDLGSALGQYQNVRMQQAQMDILEQQKTMFEYDQELKRQQALNIAMDTSNKALENQYGAGTLKDRISLAASQLQAAQGALTKQAAETENIRANTQFTIGAHERAVAMQKGNLLQQMESILETKARAANYRMQTSAGYQSKDWQNEINTKAQQKTTAEIANIRQALRNAEKDGTLKDFEIQLNKQGLTKSDGFYWRQLEQFMDNLRKLKQSSPNQQDYYSPSLRK